MKGYVIVTGGAGYIGSHVCKALALAGYIPVTYDSLILGHRDAVRWGPFVRGDISDKNLFLHTLRVFDQIACIHLAAYSNVTESIVQASRYYDNNVSGTESILEAIEEHPVEHILFASSASVYGKDSSDPISETTNIGPIHPYGQTKALAEKAIVRFCMTKEISYGILRYFNAAGADPEGQIGERHYPETHAIPLMIQALQGKISRFPLLGNAHPTENGTPIRDFIHVSDLADAHVSTLEYLRRYQKSLVINLGSGTGRSLQEIIDGLTRQTGRTIPVEILSSGAGPSRTIADISLARSLLGWEPKCSDLETILDTALRWHA